jgi:WD40 repeat protein
VVVAVVGHTTMCLGIGYSHVGRRLASASNDNTIKVWDLVGPAIPATARAMTPQPKQ